MNEHEAPAGGLGSIVARLDQWLSDERRRGDAADLRRLNPEEPDRAAFWKALAQCVEDERPMTDGESSRWAAVLAAMARMAPHAHQAGARAGGALARARFSEARFSRLLTARGRALADRLRRAAVFLASRGEPVDWTDLAALSVVTDHGKAEGVRRRIASDYYREQSRMDK
jgi:CRISPR system Cascade subunit CasB